MICQSMADYSPHLESSLIQLPAMIRKGSQAVRHEGQAHNAVINGARAKEMGHTDREQRGMKEEEAKQAREQRKE